jgi:hypothetical protein
MSRKHKARFSDLLKKAQAYEQKAALIDAFAAYEAALQLRPEGHELLLPLGRLARKLKQFDMAQSLYLRLISLSPDHDEAALELCEVWRDMGRFDDAISYLQTHLSQKPQDFKAWTALGTLMVARGDNANAVIFFNEAVGIANDKQARFHRGCALMELGEREAGLIDLEASLDGFHDADNRISVGITVAHARLSFGDLANGWPLYLKTREKSGTLGQVRYGVDAPRLDIGLDASGALLFCAEQGLGDEILFGSLLPDILRLYPEANTTIAVEPRLVKLFQRSFPQTQVIPHHTHRQNGLIHRDFPNFTARIDAFSLFGDYLSHLRPSLNSFAAENIFLKADEGRVAYWQDWLASLGSGPKFGLLWKSLIRDVYRDRYFSPFADWEAVLRRNEAYFISLQYGDVAEDLALAREQGLRLIVPPKLDLKDDLDDVAALCVALQAVIGPSNATTNLAAASGAKVYMTAPQGAWIWLGQTYHPFYPSVSIYPTKPGLDNRPILERLSLDLKARFTASGP